MISLGLSFFYHDSAAAIMKDGVIVAAVAEERMNRQKHYSGFPSLATEYCLKEAGVTMEEIDHVGFYEKPFRKFERILSTYCATWPRSLSSFYLALHNWLPRKLWIKREIRKQLKWKKSIFFCRHHLSHAAAAFLCSPYDEAAIITVDGVGEWGTTTIGHGKGNHIQIVKEINFPHSLGLFYSALTAYLGFRVNDAEWKVMGLAPYGNPAFVSHFRKVIDIKDDGSFRLDLKYFQHHFSTSRMYTDAYEELMGRPTRKPESKLEPFHEDIAHSGQKIVEEVMVKIANDLYKRHPTDNLCIAGGVGLNSVANWKILSQTPFRNVFIQPAAGDDGGAMGTALFIQNLLFKQPRKWVMDHAYLGPGYSQEEIETWLKDANIVHTLHTEEELVKIVADDLANDNVIGWYQGRMEFGPRALGHRSILGNPCSNEMKGLINSKIKFREYFRPFAPSVLKEAAPDYFEFEGDAPYMLLVTPVREEKRSVIPAVTHEDGTGRIQTVTREANGIYYNLIKAFGERTGVPVLINTSFNIRGEPIVTSPADAYHCFVNTGLDILVLGNCIIREKPNSAEIQDYVKEAEQAPLHDAGSTMR